MSIRIKGTSYSISVPGRDLDIRVVDHGFLLTCNQNQNWGAHQTAQAAAEIASENLRQKNIDEKDVARVADLSQWKTGVEVG